MESPTELSMETRKTGTSHRTQYELVEVSGDSHQTQRGDGKNRMTSVIVGLVRVDFKDRHSL
jgi:hypothetical protein